MTDPFNIVKDELKRSINKTRSLIESLNVVNNNGNTGEETSAKLLTDIRTNLKSINWDIQDLEETINIASKNPAKFNLTNGDIDNRRQFINQTREFVQKTKKTYFIDLDENNTLNKSNKKNNGAVNIRIPDLITTTTSSKTNGEYVRLNVMDESDYELDTRKPLPTDNSSANSFLSRNTSHSFQLQKNTEEIFREQDKNLDLISGRVSSLKNISQTMQTELDDQANLLDDLGREMDTTDSRMQSVMKKLTKVLHMSNDRRQWTLIGILLVAILVVLILFAIL